MTNREFNEKYKDYIEEGFYGLSFNDPGVIKYLDKEFSEEIKNNAEFKICQIKLKFCTPRVYTNSIKDSKWEEDIKEIIFSE